MKKTLVGVMALATVLSQPLAAHDAKTVIANASKAMGIDGVNSIHCLVSRTYDVSWQFCPDVQSRGLSTKVSTFSNLTKSETSSDG